MNEEWRDIPDWVGLYQASSLGRIRSLAREVKAACGGVTKNFHFRGRVLTPFAMTSGYLMVTLSRDGAKSNVSVHRAVCTAFHGACPPDREVAHYDGNKTNNRKDNLRWATKTENAADRARHGTVIRGEAKSADNRRAWRTRRARAIEAKKLAMLGGR